MTTSVDGECPVCALYRLVDRWLAEAEEERRDGSEHTSETLKECSTELVTMLPPRGHAFHDLSIGWAARVNG
jgi:hypothetical protein